MMMDKCWMCDHKVLQHAKCIVFTLPQMLSSPLIIVIVFSALIGTIVNAFVNDINHCLVIYDEVFVSFIWAYSQWIMP